VMKEWRKYCKAVRPHSAFGFKPRAPEVIVPIDR